MMPVYNADVSAQEDAVKPEPPLKKVVEEDTKNTMLLLSAPEGEKEFFDPDAESYLIKLVKSMASSLQGDLEACHKQSVPVKKMNSNPPFKAPGSKRKMGPYHRKKSQASDTLDTEQQMEATIDNSPVSQPQEYKTVNDGHEFIKPLTDDEADESEESDREEIESADY